MATAAERAKSDATITMRVPTHLRDLIDNAASALGKSRTDFMLDSARQSAVDALLDQRLFSLDAAASDAFAEALVSPPPPNAALRKLMARRR